MRPSAATGWVSIAVLAVLGTIHAQSPEPQPLEFTSPRRLTTVIGPSVATLSVAAPAGATVVSIAFFVDKTASGTKTFFRSPGAPRCPRI